MLQQSTILQRLILNPKKITKKLPVYCTHCGIDFWVWKYRIEKANKVSNGHLFCSRKCSRDHQPKRKDKFAWCDSCKWVLKTALILMPKGQVQKYNGNRTYKLLKNQYKCPNCKSML